MANEKFRGVVNDSDEAAKNIHRYNAEISTEEGEELALLMPYARSWYAIKLENGAYMFGPSKFIGYVNNDAKAYMNHKGADGRKKEARLQSISTLIEAGHPDYFDLSKTLSKFLGSFGHSPNSFSRISLIESNEGLAENGDADHIQALVSIILRLPSASIDTVKRRVAAL